MKHSWVMLRYYPAPFFEFNKGNHEKVVSRPIFVFRIDITNIKYRSKTACKCKPTVTRR
jgi:hypothetical protein